MANTTYNEDYLNYLLGLNSVPMAPVSPMLDEDLLKSQGSWMTQASKGGNLTTDLDFLMANNLLSPGAYDPVSSFDPVDAPGFRMLQQWRGGSDYEQFLASQFDSGKTANEILAELQRIVADPGDDPTAQAIAASLPRYVNYDEQTGTATQTDMPDMRAVNDELRRFESTLLSDPQYSIGPDGQPVSVTTEDSEARKAALEAGYVNTPGVGYDPYSLAPEGTYDRDLATRTALLKALGPKTYQDVLAPQMNNEVFEAHQALQRWQNRDLQGGRGEASPQPSGGGDGVGPSEAAGPVDDVGRFFARLPGQVSKIPGALDRQFGDPIEDIGSGRRDIVLNGSYGSGNSWSLGVPDQFVSQVGASAQSDPRSGGAPGTSGWAASLPQNAQRQAGAGWLMNSLDRGMEQRLVAAQKKAQEQRVARRAATATYHNASDAELAAQYQRQQRQAMADQLLSMGRSPFQDEVARRNAAVYGMGM